MPSGPVRDPNRTTWLPGPLRGGLLQVLVPHDAHAERVDQRVSRIAGVKGQLAADVGQAEAVSVEGDAADHPGQHPPGVRRARRAEPERVHHRDRPGAHGQDVPDDPAHAGRRALERLHVRRVVVRLDLERDGVALADVHDPGVVPDAGQQRIGRRRLLGELAQVHPGGLVGAVLAPHDRVDRQLGVGRPPARMSLMLAYSPSVRPSSACGCGRCGLAAAAATVSRDAMALSCAVIRVPRCAGPS